MFQLGVGFQFAALELFIEPLHEAVFARSHKPDWAIDKSQCRYTDVCDQTSSWLTFHIPPSICIWVWAHFLTSQQKLRLRFNEALINCPACAFWHCPSRLSSASVSFSICPGQSPNPKPNSSVDPTGPQDLLRLALLARCLRESVYENITFDIIGIYGTQCYQNKNEGNPERPQKKKNPKRNTTLKRSTICEQ